MNKGLSILKVLFQEYLEAQKFHKSPFDLYEPNNYILSLGGKRLRPLLVLLACELFGKDAKAALPAALCIEYFHNFTLMHDDIMDEATIRRGKPTVHKKFGVNNAILSGDVLLIYAYQSLSAYDSTIQKKLFELFNRTAIEVCEGQSMDTSFENRNDVNEVEYIEMIRLKTAVLMAAALKMGAIIGGAEEEEAQLFYEYGENIGIAFQIQDDILDTFGDDKVGKKIGGDIIQNKKTLLLIKALAASVDKDDDRLQLLLGNSTINPIEKVNQVKEIYHQYDVLEYTDQLKNQFVQKSKTALQTINQSHDFLIDMADKLINRKY